jgi:tRNA threonylcarbamoyladenosine biosynthesis protein TsaE
MPLHLRSAHPDETAAIGRSIAALLVPGDVVVLSGPLGAGKTRLVQGIAEGLGVPGRVTSPTFVIVRRHAGRMPLVHVDAYRLSEARDLVGLDDDVLADDVITCIEWGGNVEDALPADRLDCELIVAAASAAAASAAASAEAGADDDTSRTIVIDARGPSWTGRSARLAVALADHTATAAVEHEP